MDYVETFATRELINQILDLSRVESGCARRAAHRITQRAAHRLGDAMKVGLPETGKFDPPFGILYPEECFDRGAEAISSRVRRSGELRRARAKGVSNLRRNRPGEPAPGRLGGQAKTGPLSFGSRNRMERYRRVAVLPSFPLPSGSAYERM